jgi:hypothetical protein
MIENFSMYPLSPILVQTPDFSVIVFVDIINEIVYDLAGEAIANTNPIVIEVLHNIREEKKEVDAFLSSEEIGHILNTREKELAKTPTNA